VPERRTLATHTVPVRPAEGIDTVEGLPGMRCSATGMAACGSPTPD